MNHMARKITEDITIMGIIAMASSLDCHLRLVQEKRTLQTSNYRGRAYKDVNECFALFIRYF